MLAAKAREVAIADGIGVEVWDASRIEREVSMADLLIRDVRPLGGDTVDVLVRDGTIARIGPSVPLPGGAVVEDGQGAILLPGLIEGHGHLDKTVWGGLWYRNEIGPTRDERIENERIFRRNGTHDAAARSLGLAKAYIAHGTTRMRSHADIDTEIGLRHVHATMRTRETLAAVLDMQIVAFPQSGLVCRPMPTTLESELYHHRHVNFVPARAHSRPASSHRE